MPPRRKRRDSAGRKEPLRFVESPLHIPHALPSPVFAADFPCTADVVPIEDTSANWVSPQFHEPPRPSRVTRARRQRNTTETTDSARGKKLDKLVPLKFHGEDTPSPQLLSKHCKDKGKNKVTKASKEPHKRKPRSHKTPEESELHESDMEGGRRTSKRINDLNNKKSKAKTTLLTDDVYGIKATGAYKRLQHHQAATATDDELPTDFTDIKSTKKRKLKKAKRLNLSPDLDITLPENEVNVGDRSNISNSPAFGTQHLPLEGKKRTKGKRLFPCSESDSKTIAVQEENVEDKTMEALPNVSDTFCPPEVNTPEIREVIKHLQPPLSARCPNIPVRINHESTSLKCVLGSTPLRTEATPKTVLAYDTPESEYGMPVRQRRLRHWKCSSS